MTTRVMFPFVGDSVGGSHVSAALLMAALPEQGFSPLAVVHRDGPLHAWLRSRGLPVMRADLPFLSVGGGIAGLARIAAAAPRLALFARSNEFAIVHAHDGRMIATWMPAARLARSVAIAHRRTRWSPSRLAHLSLRIANGVVAISNYVRDSLPDDLRARASVIANPFEAETVDVGRARAAVRKLTGAATAVVAFVGTLQSQKRPEIFLRAAARIHRQRGDVRFILIGRATALDAPMRKLSQDLGIGAVTTFTGFREDARFLLAGCDLLMAPAIEEGHGRVLLEAMMAGVPVIAAASGGHVEIVQPEHTGLLVPADMPDAFAAAGLRLLTEPRKTEALVAAAQAYVSSTYSKNAHAFAVAAIYRRFLALA